MPGPDRVRGLHPPLQAAGESGDRGTAAHPQDGSPSGAAAARSADRIHRLADDAVPGPYLRLAALVRRARCVPKKIGDLARSAWLWPSSHPWSRLGRAAWHQRSRAPVTRPQTGASAAASPGPLRTPPVRSTGTSGWIPRSCEPTSTRLVPARIRRRPSRQRGRQSWNTRAKHRGRARTPAWRRWCGR